MNNQQRQTVAPISESRRMGYPLHRVSGAVAAADAEAVVADLTAHGFPAESIEVHSGEGVRRK